jgi:hypothetical protein
MWRGRIPSGKVGRYVLLLPRSALNPYKRPGTVIRGYCKLAAWAHAQFLLQTAQSGKARLGFVMNCRTDMIWVGLNTGWSRSIFMMYVTKYFYVPLVFFLHPSGLVMVQVVSIRLFISEAGVWFQPSLWEISDEQRFISQYFGFLFQYYAIFFFFLPLALQPAVGFGLSSNILPFFPICHQLSPSSLNLSSFSLCSTLITISIITTKNTVETQLIVTWW